MGQPASESALWQAQGDAKRAAVQSMFAAIAPTYDLMNTLLSGRLHHRWRRAAVQTLNLQPGNTVLDVCCGTGDFLTALRQAVGPRGHLVGIDFCAPMLDRARPKPHHATLTLGDACELPVASGTFDAVTVGWGIRNVPNIDAAHREVVRALRPGGRFASVDMAIPRHPWMRRLSTWVFTRVAPRLGAMVGHTEAYTYLPESTQTFLDREGLRESMERAGLVDVRYRDFLFGNVCLHTGRRP